jgi:hypothetical protein
MLTRWLKPTKIFRFTIQFSISAPVQRNDEFWNASLHDPTNFGGKEPKDGQQVTVDKIPDFVDFGLGCFLLAGSEVYKLK